MIAPLCSSAIGLDIKFRSPLPEKIEVLRGLYKDLLILVEETAVGFGRNISRETAAEYIDEKTARILKKIVKKPRMGIKEKKK